MTVTYRSTLRRTVAAALSQAAIPSAARARPQPLTIKDGQYRNNRHLTTSTSLDSAVYFNSNAQSTHDTQRPEPALSHAAPPNLHHDVASPDKKTALRGLSLEKLLRLVAPETYSGGVLEAQNLAEALKGLEDGGEGVIRGIPRRQLWWQIQRFFDNRNGDLGTFLSYRNAMLAQSWPDARRHMINIHDGRWPPLVLQRVILKVSTPSEISDALAILQTSLEHTRHMTQEGTPLSLKTLRFCAAYLTKITVKEDGNALHLLLRLTDLLMALVEGFPAHSIPPGDLVNDFVRRCTGLQDERARQAITRVLDWLESQQDSEPFQRMRHNVLRHCINSIQASMTSTPGKSAASEQIGNIQLMDYLLRLDYGSDTDLHQRALQCSVFVAGHARNYQRTWQSFNEYQEYKQKHGSAMACTDYQLLAKALVRSQQGRKEAWHVFLQAEQLLCRQPKTAFDGVPSTTQSRRRTRELEAACIDLLQVMATSPDVSVTRIFSMLGVFLRDTDRADSRPFVTGERLSRVMHRRRSDVRAYAVVMQGLLMRKRPQCALTVWQVMLRRGVMPNAVVLSLLLQNLFEMRDVRSALQQLHLWCEQGVPKPTGPRHQLNDIEVSSLSSSTLAEVDPLMPSNSAGETGEATERHIVTPDVVLATIVFNGLHKCGSSGVASLWEAYQLTLKRFPDAPVLAMMLKASCPDNPNSSIDAKFGRRVFRSMLFRKHPELAEYRNSLIDQLESNSSAGWIFSDDTVGSRMEGWLGSVFQPKEATSATPPVDIGDPKALVFTSKLFEHYLRLVLHLQHSSGVQSGARASRQELVELLGWMRELQVTPSATHLALTVLEIEENLPPAVAARQMEALDKWLVEWLGEEAMPQDQVMQRHWQWKIKRNGQRRGWFDRVAGPREIAVDAESNEQRFS